jgi:hypothetical protein
MKIGFSFDIFLIYEFMECEGTGTVFEFYVVELIRSILKILNNFCTLVQF